MGYSAIAAGSPEQFSLQVPGHLPSTVGAAGSLPSFELAVSGCPPKTLPCHWLADSGQLLRHLQTDLCLHAAHLTRPTSVQTAAPSVRCPLFDELQPAFLA